MTTIPLPLHCKRCGEAFAALIDAERLRALYDDGVSAEDVAASFTTGLLSQELTCPSCAATSVN